MNKIKKTSLIFRVLFQILFVVLPVLLIVAWVQSAGTFEMVEGVINLNYVPAAYAGNILHPLSFSEKMLALGAACLPLLVQLYVLFSLIQLFKLYEQGVIFSIDNVRHIRNIGYALIVTQIMNVLYQGLMGFILTWHNPPGHHFSSIALDHTNIGVILVALMVILISWIMLEGCKIREEQQLTV
ncbi:MAG: DUF2975 domain-containing protein [Legionella sp.]|jgi:hypothetical protein